MKLTDATAWPVLDPDAPPVDFTRENAAYEKERERLIAEHRGKIALIHEDELVGIFPTADEALLEGYRRFGLVKMMLKQIDDSDSPEVISHVDTQHPSFRKVEQRQSR
jgi:hypothetical protein